MYEIVFYLPSWSELVAMFCPMKFCSEAKASTDGIRPSPRDIRLGVCGINKQLSRNPQVLQAYLSRSSVEVARPPSAALHLRSPIRRNQLSGVTYTFGIKFHAVNIMFIKHLHVCTCIKNIHYSCIQSSETLQLWSATPHLWHEIACTRNFSLDNNFAKLHVAMCMYNFHKCANAISSIDVMINIATW
jgi:hypothetical protein